MTDLAKSEAQVDPERRQEDRRKGADANFSGPERRSLKDRRIENNRQFSTFFLEDRLYGIDVMRVQEVTKAMPITRVPLAPVYVEGLINLRGQIATAISLRKLFGIEGEAKGDPMNVVCRVDGLLLSLIVDRIGDVLELGDSFFESSPDTVPIEIRKYMEGVYKTPQRLLSIIEIEKISESIQKQEN